MLGERWLSFRFKWFPYRTARYLGYDRDAGELLLGPWKWHRPDRFTKSVHTEDL